MSFQQTDIPAQRVQHLAMLNQQMVSINLTRFIGRFIFIPSILVVFLLSMIAFRNTTPALAPALAACVLCVMLFGAVDMFMFGRYAEVEIAYRQSMAESFDMKPDFVKVLPDIARVPGHFGAYLGLYSTAFSIYVMTGLVLLVVTAFAYFGR